ncbi:Methyltransferase type 12 [Solidesulfovibrio fructosivorans JJ]]|uniref:Methyltransferase type 12 n=1 Tax=Solidesulfovibrio fructosivorans JJ] TaxID=596151 RepID=E1JS27_SOLFR|nr:class I SAM-dependent methyltransferase [Solidesulfovibrio fructosivorans]EFL52796.1 Methyltransferase type 12 [Solidesulfovibrio fructosivorans JJ]]
MTQNLSVPQTDFTLLEALAISEIASRAVLESTRLGIFDVLADVSLAPSEVAAKFEFQEAKTEALLALLASLGLLATDAGAYRATPLAAEYLRHDSPFFMGKGMELNQRFIRSIATDFTGLLRGTADLRSDTDALWAVEDTLEGAEQFARIGPLQAAVAFLSGLPGFDRWRRMCDVGGNHGTFAMALLDKNPRLRADLVDLPEVAEAAADRIAARGYADRMTAFSCDLRKTSLESERYDLLFVSHVLYGFMDNLADVLSMFHAALTPGGWVVSHHMSPESRVPASIVQGREFMTRMAGYSTHAIGREFLENVLREVGFDNITVASAGHHQSSLLVAGQKA